MVENIKTLSNVNGDYYISSLKQSTPDIWKHLQTLNITRNFATRSRTMPGVTSQMSAKCLTISAHTHLLSEWKSLLRLVIYVHSSILVHLRF